MGVREIAEKAAVKIDKKQVAKNMACCRWEKATRGGYNGNGTPEEKKIGMEKQNILAFRIDEVLFCGSKAV